MWRVIEKFFPGPARKLIRFDNFRKVVKSLDQLLTLDLTTFEKLSNLGLDLTTFEKLSNLGLDLTTFEKLSNLWTNHLL